MRWASELLYYNLTFFAEVIESDFSSSHTQTLASLEAIPKSKSIGTKLFQMQPCACVLETADLINSAIWHLFKSVQFSQHWQLFRIAPNKLAEVPGTIAALSLLSAQANLSCPSARLINSDETAGITLLRCIWFIAPSSEVQH